MIDVHCHLDHFENWRDLLTPELETVITAGLGRESISRSLEMSGEKVKVTAGCDPRKYEEGLAEFILSVKDKIVGIGEVGLDWYPEKKEEQKTQFAAYIDLAGEVDLPLVVHSRSAGKYALQMLKEKGAERVVMHAFDGKAGYAKKAAENGYFFTVPPSIARSRQKQKLVKAVPLDNLLLESDAPALAPVRGETNVPANVSVSAGWIADLKDIDLREVEKATTENAKKMFCL